jgi:hypothetical protein
MINFILFVQMFAQPIFSFNQKNKIILNFMSNGMGIKSTTISYFVKSMRVHRPHFRTTGELVHDGLTISI